jgi:hypothetical protein
VGYALIERRVVYFRTAGRSNTDQTLLLARERAQLLDTRHLVVATGGATGLRAAQVFQDTSVHIVGVTLHAGRWSVYAPPDWDLVRQAEAMGVRFHTGTHSLVANAERAVRDRYGGIGPGELIADTLTILSVGVKVAVEVTLMAADANLVPVGEDVIAVAGTNGGADTALVVRPAFSSTLFDLRIKEIICKPLAG